ncbi:MAG: hypothetical protein U0794_06565 [Isosphaeraceae bacterium]
MLLFVFLFSSPAFAQPPKPLVIPFDFESKFDDGHYGQSVAEMFFAKLKRAGGFVLPESLQEVRDWCERNRFHPNPDTPLDALKKAVQTEQAGDIGIWGKVERAEGEATDVYDVTVLVADFRVDPPRVLHRKTGRTKTVSEIPHVFVYDAMTAITGKAAPRPVEAGGPLRGSVKGASLVQGAFDSLRGWDPPTALITRRSEKTDQGANSYLHFEIPEDVAASTGVLHYSDYFPVVAGGTYRFHCRFRTSGSAVKVFVKAYDALPGKFAPDGGEIADVARREVYRSQQNLVGKPGQWTEHTEDFTPKHSKFKPKWARVMLYGYWPKGTVDWDDVSVLPVSSAARD